MARIVGQPNRCTIVTWSEAYFYVNGGEQVLPLDIMLHEHEMQAWARNPNGMDANFEPDLRRPGKFRAKATRIV